MKFDEKQNKFVTFGFQNAGKLSTLLYIRYVYISIHDIESIRNHLSSVQEHN